MKYFLTIATTAVILIAVLLPGSSLPDVSSFGLDKIIHFILFFSWAIAVRYDFSTLKKIIVLVLGILFSFLTEILQLFVEDRSYDLYDMIADSLGLVMALILSYLVIPLITSLRKKLPGS